MNDFVIEKNVPMPGHSSTGMPRWGILGKMEIGDSFVLPFDGNPNLRATVMRAGYSKGIKLSMRTIPEGFRVWRVK